MSDKPISWEDAVRSLCQQPDQAEFVRHCYYDDPLKEAAERFHNSSEWASVRHYLPTNKGRVLDLGAGRGISSYAFAKDGWTVTALEPDSSPLVGANAIRALASQTGLLIDVVENRGESLPFAAGEFDVVYARQSLHHADDLGVLCREAGRVLKTGGVLVATREHVISRKADLQAFLQGHPLHALYGGEHAYLLSEYLEALRSGGVTVKTILGPTSSDINLYPNSLSNLKRRWANRLFLPAACMPNLLLHLRDAVDRTPGRLYSFIGVKK